MTVSTNCRTILACATAMPIALLAAGPALAAETSGENVSQSVVVTQSADSSTTNPNLAAWSLINIIPTDVAASNAGSGVTVAVIDGEVECGDKALVGRCSSFGINSATYSSYNAHGTHVAGIVAASPYGVAPGATILNYGVFADSGYVGSGSALSDSWKAAYKAGATITNMSFNCAKKALCWSSGELTTASSADAPLLYVKSAGNDGADLVTETSGVSLDTATRAVNRVLIVGSVGATGTMSGWSNRAGTGCLLQSGASTCASSLLWMNHFLVAPGEGIYSTLPTNSAGYMSGTSMAAPVVAGAAALLEARWPLLKTSPESVAQILLTSATDLGTPGVDPVYGYGLLNVGAAFLANGTITLVSSTGTTTKVKGKRVTSSTTFVQMSAVLGNVTVYDRFGRDFKLAETGALEHRSDVLSAHQQLGRRLLGATDQADWAEAFFGDTPPARSFALYGSAGDQPIAGLALDQSLRAGLDLPFKGGSAQMRLTGASNVRTDLAFDPAMRPLAYFASTGLVRGAFLSSAQLKVSEHSRLMLYGMATAGAVKARMPEEYVPGMRLTERGFATSASLAVDEPGSKQAGFGVGYWTRPDSSTVLGVNLSAVTQRHGFYDLTSDLSDFDRPTRMVNLGVAGSRKVGSWEATASGEFTHLRQSGSGGIGFTPAMLASAEATVSKTGLFARGSSTDKLRLAVSVPPRAISGELHVDYLGPTSDRLGRQANDYRVPLANLGAEPVRVEAAYELRSSQGWSLALSGGIHLAKQVGSANAEGLASFRAQF